MANTCVPDLLVLMVKGWIREGPSPQRIMIQCDKYNNIVIVDYLGHPRSREYLFVSLNSYFGCCQPLSGPHLDNFRKLNSLPCLLLSFQFIMDTVTRVVTWKRQKKLHIFDLPAYRIKSKTEKNLECKAFGLGFFLVFCYMNFPCQWTSSTFCSKHTSHFSFFCLVCLSHSPFQQCFYSCFLY